MQNKKKATALIKACSQGDTETVKSLLEAGANPNRQNRFGETTLTSTIRNTKITELLIKAGADINVQNKNGHTSLKGNTALIYAAIKKSNSSIIKLLLQAGADVTIRDNKGKTALDYMVGHVAANQEIAPAFFAFSKSSIP